MRILLPSIKTVLKELPLLQRKSDCYITPHVNWMPTGTRFPCLGIKDGGMARQELAGDMLELTATINLVAFTPITADGGDAVCGQVGVLAILNAAVSLLIDNHLGMTEIQRMAIGADMPSELYQAENNQWIVKMVRTVVYTMERPNT